MPRTSRPAKRPPSRRPARRAIYVPDTGNIAARRVAEEMERVPRPLLDAIQKTLHASGDDLKSAILTRCLSLTSRAMERVPSRILLEAAAASTDQETMLRILEAPEMAVPGTDAADIDAARARGIEARDQLIHAEGGSWPTDQVARYLGLTRQAVDKRRKANKLIGLALGRHGYLYPSWQINKNGVLPGLEDVLQVLGGHDPWAQIIFMLSPNDRLDGMSPLRVLREGRIDDVKTAASLLGEHGAA